MIIYEECGHTLFCCIVMQLSCLVIINGVASSAAVLSTYYLIEFNIHVALSIISLHDKDITHTKRNKCKTYTCTTYTIHYIQKGKHSKKELINLIANHFRSGNSSFHIQ